MEFTIEYITEWGGGHGRPWEVDITKEMCAEKGGVHRRPWEVEFKPWSCHVRGDIMRDVRHGIGRAHGRPWEAMGGGGSSIRFCKSHGRWRYGGDGGDGGDVPSK